MKKSMMYVAVAATVLAFAACGQKETAPAEIDFSAVTMTQFDNDHLSCAYPDFLTEVTEKGDVYVESADKKIHLDLNAYPYQVKEGEEQDSMLANMGRIYGKFMADEQFKAEAPQVDGNILIVKGVRKGKVKTNITVVDGQGKSVSGYFIYPKSKAQYCDSLAKEIAKSIQVK